MKTRYSLQLRYYKKIRRKIKESRKIIETLNWRTSLAKHFTTVFYFTLMSYNMEHEDIYSGKMHGRQSDNIEY